MSGAHDNDFCRRSSYCSAAEETERMTSAHVDGVAGREDWRWVRRREDWRRRREGRWLLLLLRLFRLFVLSLEVLMSA